MDGNIEMNKRESNKGAPQPPPECPSYPTNPMTYTNLGSPPPYTSSGYNMEPPPYQSQPPAFVVTGQPYMVAPYPEVIRDHLYWSITNLLCCNLLLGIFALVFSAKARSSIRLGHSAAASRYSRTAGAFNIIGFIAGIVSHVIWISFLVYWAVTHGVRSRSFYSGSSSNQYNNYNHFHR